jgi:hypothetical protein
MSSTIKQQPRFTGKEEEKEMYAPRKKPSYPLFFPPLLTYLVVMSGASLYQP